MTLHITSDIHFFHDNILKFEGMMKYRGSLYWRIDAMHDGIIKVWNKDVKPNDEVIIVGDFCFGYKDRLQARLEEILPKLNGTFTLVRGNHDPHSGDQVWRDHGHKVVDYLEKIHHDQKSNTKTTVCISHYPFAVWNKMHYGAVMLHGHSHGGYVGQGRILDVGWDVHGRVITFKEAVDIAMQKDVVSVDGH